MLGLSLDEWLSLGAMRWVRTNVENQTVLERLNRCRLAGVDWNMPVSDCNRLPPAQEVSQLERSSLGILFDVHVNGVSVGR
jgi:hypothetical protein